VPEPSGSPVPAADVSYDPLAPATLADPFPAYAELRARCPVHHHAGFTPPFFTLSRYDDVRDALIDHGTWSIRYGQSPQYTRPAGLVNDPPEHTAFRHLFSRAFTPRTVSRIEGDIVALAEELVDDFAPLGAGDLHDRYACPLPTIVIARLLGIPPEDLARFKQMSNDLTATYNAPDPRESAGPRAAFDAYFTGILAERRERVAAASGAGIPPGPEHVGTVLPDDLITSFLVAEVEGRRLTDHELCWMLLLLLLGGNETSTALLTNVLWRLLEEPVRWDALVRDPALVDAAVEEALRHDPPVLGLFRTPTHDVTRHGVTIPHKAKVMVCFASANHDEAVFDDPESFRLDRPADELKRHLTFGFGAHFCPGAALARLEARITLRLFARRLPGLRLAGDPERIVAFNLWGRRTLPATW
jgi:cytochrome P450